MTKGYSYVKKWRKKHPLKAAYVTLKYNAKRRGVHFDISFEYFQKFAFKTKLMTCRGVKSESFSVDRIQNWKGYVEGNLQMLTLAENGRKGFIEGHYYYVEGVGMIAKYNKKGESFEDSPF